MKTYTIILFVILQSFLSVVFSQEIRDGYRIFTEASRFSPGEQFTVFEDVNRYNYKGAPKNKDGEELWDFNNANFSSREKLRRIEREVYSEEERNYMVQYIPNASPRVRASDGKIVSITFTFVNLPDSSVIDTSKLRKFQNKIMEETYFEDISFSGGEAASGYFAGNLWLFRH